LPIRKPRLQKKNKSTLKAQRKTGWGIPSLFFYARRLTLRPQGLAAAGCAQSQTVAANRPRPWFAGRANAPAPQLSGQPHILGMHQAQTRGTDRVEQAVFIDQTLLGLRTGTRGAVYLAIGLHPPHQRGVF